MIVEINGIEFYDVEKFSFNEAELSMTFNKGHEYSNIEEIADELLKAEIQVGNFYFKGVSMWKYGQAIEEMHTQGTNPFNEEGDTSVLCMIPLHVRGSFDVGVIG